jgi:hypothetical protein
MSDSKKTSAGLTDLEVLESAKIHGKNSVEHAKKNHFLISLVDIIKEPMFILLFTATSIYFITGDYGDGIFMAIAIVFVIAISVFQESRSRNAIEALKKLGYVRQYSSSSISENITNSFTLINSDIDFINKFEVDELVDITNNFIVDCLFDKDNKVDNKEDLLEFYKIWDVYFNELSDKWKVLLLREVDIIYERKSFDIEFYYRYNYKNVIVDIWKNVKLNDNL